jgi:LAO/AO transport system kinase
MKRRAAKDPDYYISGIRDGNRYKLSEAITLIESDHSEKRKVARTLVDYFTTQNTADSLRLAITGPPGVGKSTFINAYGKNLIDNGEKVAVLAVDPSSSRTKGSILGDKTRMYDLSLSENAFVRPSPNSSYLGGINRRTKEAIVLCEAAGFRHIVIETVGVGQSEHEVSDICDMTMLILQPGSGDDLQGIKRGIMEMADVFIINKADGEQKTLALSAKKFLLESQKYFSHDAKVHGSDNVFLCSSLTNEGIEDIVSFVKNRHREKAHSGDLIQKRKEQEQKWFVKKLDEAILLTILSDPHLAKLKEKLMEDISNQLLLGPGAIDAFVEVMTQSLISKP